MHLGLTVDKDADGTVTKEEPWFTNFQYDGRVDWGLGEGLIAEGFGVIQQMMDTVLGDAYPATALSLREAILLDLQVKGGALTRAQAANLTRAEIDAIAAQSAGDAQIQEFMDEFEWRMNAEGKLKPGYRARRRAREEAGGDSEAVEAEAGAQPEGATESVRVEAGVEAGTEEHAPSEGWQGKLMAWYRNGMAGAESAGLEGARNGRRRLSNHDEWGGVLLSLRLGRFANVYTQVRAACRPIPPSLPQAALSLPASRGWPLISCAPPPSPCAPAYLTRRATR